MPVGATVQVVGLKQTINGLGKIDKQLQKDFKADATAIAQPAINAGKAVYKELPLSGMKYNWTQRNRKLFPFTTYKPQLVGPPVPPFFGPPCRKVSLDLVGGVLLVPPLF